MNRYFLLTATFALAACTDPVDTGVDPSGRQPVVSMSGSQSGSEDILVCIEAERTAIPDPTAVPQGATISAEGYLQTLDSEWSGDLVVDGVSQALTVTFEADATALDFVIYADENWEQGDPVPYDEDDGCEDQYELDVVMHVVSGTELDELVSVPMRGWSAYPYLFVPAEIDDADVTGTLTPTDFDLATAPNPWLLLGFNQTETSTQLTVAWFDDIAEDDTDNPIIDDFGSVSLSAQ